MDSFVNLVQNNLDSTLWFRPELALVRNEAGDFQFGEALIGQKAGDPSTTQTSQGGVVAAIMAELLDPPDPTKRTGYLTEAAIYDGTVSIDDRHAVHGPIRRIFTDGGIDLFFMLQHTLHQLFRERP